MASTLAAYYYPLGKSARSAGKAGVFELHMIELNGATHNLTPSPVYVSGMAEARRQAKANGATPWNF